MTLIRKFKNGNVAVFRDIYEVNKEIREDLIAYYGNTGYDFSLAMSQQKITESDYLGMIRVS